MKAQRGHEMRKFLLSVSVLVVLLIAAVIVLTTWDAVRRIDQEMEREKEGVVSGFAEFVGTSFEELLQVSTDPETMTGVFSEEMLYSEDLEDQLRMLQALAELERAQYTAMYYQWSINGMPVAVSVKEGVEISDFPTEMPEEEYVILDELAGEEGFFISFFYATDWGTPGIQDQFLNFAVDRTEQMQALEDFYAEEKSNLITRQIIIGIIAIVVALLLTTLGVYYLTRRYITGPINELADTSHRIMQGTFEGEVQVVEGSDYADLQRLLQSGQKMIEKMSEIEK